ncbi:hypothetical protein VMCG_10865 [Cytospora schulzeri]|uniref:Velvet domain-containing protein n=1 Tax=Cytospora schulzeri TaxID=448051 RepID=A0A423V7V4_9PEZI|nr:hypothetical protein VMCG_10865 [Valsa malicola]
MSSSTQTMSRQVTVDIVVQPPSIIGLTRRLIPPVVARTSDPQLISDVINNSKQVYATSMLTSTNGEDYTSALNGNWNVTAQLIANSGGSRGGSSSRHSRSQWLYFVFDPVRIGVQGTYTFTVVISALSLTEGSSVVVGGKTTRPVTVVNQAAPPERPSSSERQVLRQLEAAGLYRP